MEEGDRRRFRHRGRERENVERKCDFSLLPFPKDGKLTVKNVAYLHVFCRVPPQTIAARGGVGLADVHLGLAHYYLNPGPIDAEIKREIEFNRRDTLGDTSASLPKIGLDSLVEAANE